jgi:hypothetical protein
MVCRGALRDSPYTTGATGRHMPMLTLGQAAKLTGLGKTTITRAIKGGRLSANRRDDGSYEIDPAELSRVYSFRPEPPETVAQSGHVVHPATPAGDSHDSSGDPEVTARLSALEEQVRGLKDLLEEVKRSRDKAESASDHWREQAALTLRSLPAPKPEQAAPVERRSWWRRLAG